MQINKNKKLISITILLAVMILSFTFSSCLSENNPLLSLFYKDYSLNEIENLIIYEDEKQAILSADYFTAYDQEVNKTVLGKYSFANESVVAFGMQSDTTVTLQNVKVEFLPKPKSEQSTKRNYRPKSTLIKNLTIRAVATDGAENYFGNVNCALQNTSTNKVYLLPNLPKDASETDNNALNNQLYSHKIFGNLTLEAGKSLILPYQITDYSAHDYENREASGYAPEMVNGLIIDGVLTVNGELIIGGEVGVDNQGAKQGHTSGKYSEITLKQGAKIISNGKIVCLGYLKEQIEGGAQLIAQCGDVYAPITVYDYPNINATIGSYYLNDLPTAPFNVFDFANIQVAFTCKYGANFWGYLDLYNDTVVDIPSLNKTLVIKRHTLSTVKIIGSIDALIILKDDLSQVICDYNQHITHAKSDIYGLTTLKICGNASFGSINFKLPMLNSYKEINSSELFFPISYKFNIELCGGVFDVENKIKFLPGASLTVSQGATLNVNGDLIFYQEYNDFEGKEDSCYPSDLIPAECVINGNMNVNAPFGGNISSNCSNAKVVIDKQAQTLLSVKESYAIFSTARFVEIIGDLEAGKLAYQEYAPTNAQIRGALTQEQSLTVTQSLNLPCYADSGSYSQAGVYYYKQTDGNSGWVTSAFEISYQTNDSSINLPETNIVVEDCNGFAISLSQLNLSRDFYSFGGWYYNCDFTQKVADGDIIYQSTTLFAKWNANYYMVNFHQSNGFESWSESFAFTEEISAKNLPVYGNENGESFLGWYLDNQFKLLVLSYAQALKGANENNQVDLYAKWQKQELLITLNTNNEEYLKQVQPIQAQSISQLSAIEFPKALEDTKTKYFAGWYCGETKVCDWSFVNQDKSLYELVAHWESKYKLTFASEHPSAQDLCFTANTVVWLSPAQLQNGYSLENLSVESIFDQSLTTFTKYDSDITVAHYFTNGWSDEQNGNDKISVVTKDLFIGKEKQATLFVLWGSKNKILINCGSMGDSESSVTEYILTVNGTQIESQSFYLMNGDLISVIATNEKHGIRPTAVIKIDLNGEIIVEERSQPTSGSATITASANITVNGDATVNIIGG